MVKAGMDYNSIVARLIELDVAKKKASELATTALEEEARERVAATKAAGDSADKALASIADLKLSFIEAENIVREFYETWTSDAEVAAAAQLKLFQETAAQLPKILQGFEMGERSIAGMARMGEFGDVIDIRLILALAGELAYREDRALGVFFRVRASQALAPIYVCAGFWAHDKFPHHWFHQFHYLFRCGVGLLLVESLRMAIFVNQCSRHIVCDNIRGQEMR